MTFGVVLYALAVGGAVAYSLTAGRRYSQLLEKKGQARLVWFDERVVGDPLALVRSQPITRAWRLTWREQTDPELERARRRYRTGLIAMLIVSVIGLPLL